MQRTKANFRALREKMDISQDTLAMHVHVSPKTMKNWENPNHPMNPPEDVWQWLIDKHFIFTNTINNALDKVEEIKKQVGNYPKYVTLTYYRSQYEYNKHAREHAGSFAFVNAMTRATGLELERLGIEILYTYPNDPENVYRRFSDERGFVDEYKVLQTDFDTLD